MESKYNKMLGEYPDIKINTYKCIKDNSPFLKLGNIFYIYPRIDLDSNLQKELKKYVDKGIDVYSFDDSKYDLEYPFGFPHLIPLGSKNGLGLALCIFKDVFFQYFVEDETKSIKECKYIWREYNEYLLDLSEKEVEFEDFLEEKIDKE